MDTLSVQRPRTGRIIFGVLGGLALCCLFGGCWAVASYNRVRTMDESVRAAWSQVDNQLQRRYDLVPNLVETVKGYAQHEQDLFGKIADARAAYTGAQAPPQKIEAANRLEGLLSRLLVIREAYPELKANQGFLKLQDQLEGTENRIAVERMRYNDSVQRLNSYRRTLMGGIVARWASVGEAKYYEPPSEARTAPKVSFSR